MARKSAQSSHRELALKFWSSPDRLRWVNALSPSMQRINFSDRPWPWELRAYLSLSELWELRHIEGLSATPRVFLRRAEAVQWGLLPAQAVASEESPSPDKQLNDLGVGIQASAHAQNAPEQPEAKTVLPPSGPDAAQTPGPKVESGGSPSTTPASAASERKERPKEAASAKKLRGVERGVYDAMKNDPPRKSEYGYATRLWTTKGFKKKGVPLKTVQNYVSRHRKDLEVAADNARKLPKKPSRRK